MTLAALRAERGRGRRYGNEEPRLWTPPLRELTPETSAGYSVISFAEDVLGITLLPWQKWLLIHALELLPSGRYRFRKVVLLVGRQNGKTTLIQVLSLWRIYVDAATLVIGTAQNLDISEEAWTGAVEMAQGVPELADEIENVDRTNGKKQLRLVNGARYKIAAATRRGGRGLSGDLVLLDELREHQTWEAWSAITKTTNARPRAQIWCVSNAGDLTSVVLNHLRTQGLATLNGGGDQSLGLFEWSAPPAGDTERGPITVKELAETDVDDLIEQILASNPGTGHTIELDTLLSDALTDTDAVYRTEVLCQWVDAMGEPPFPMDRWQLTRRTRDVAKMYGAVWLGIDCAPTDRGTCSVAAAGWVNLPADPYKLGTGPRRVAHGELVAYGPTSERLLRRIVEIVERNDVAGVVLDPTGPAGELVDRLRELGVEVETTTAGDMARACAGLHNDLRNLQWSHLGQSHLDAAVQGAVKRPLGDAWALKRRDATVDISPAVAVVIARHKLMENADLDYDVGESIY